LLGLWRSSNPDYSSWQDLAQTHGIRDLPGFVRVAYIHNSSYLGGLIGLVAAIIHLQREKTKQAKVRIGSWHHEGDDNRKKSKSLTNRLQM
jgi:hypothetical protein